jgi:NTP pyrophosphatase (non-canonical NTP hydrolase)
MKFFETDFNILKTEIHQTAKEKGWWDNPRNVGEILMLVISELAESLEAKRKGKDSAIEAFDWYCIENKKDFDKDAFERYIKDSVADELADAVIRLLDYAAFKEVEIDLFKWGQLGDFHPHENFSSSLLAITETVIVINNSTDNVLLEAHVNSFILRAIHLAESESIDLHKHILLKMLYNKTRERMHGKKF